MESTNMRDSGLRAQDECFRKIFDHSHDAGFIVDPVHDAILDVNWRACELLGYGREELLQLSASTVHPSEMDRFRGFLETVSSSGGGWTDELTCTAKSGERIPVEISASVVEIVSGRHVVAWARDMRDRKRTDAELARWRKELELRVQARTADLQEVVERLNQEAGERQRAEAELRRSEERYRQLVELSPETIIVHIDGQIRYANPASAKLFGAQSSDELIGRHILDFISDEHLPAARERLETIRAGDEPESGEEFTFIGLDGEPRTAGVSSGPAVYGKPSARQVIARDVTARRRAEDERDQLEAQLRQKRKLEAIGTLAGGIAHDFNNLLTVIRGNAELALEAVEQDDPISDNLREIREVADRAAALTGQLLAFGRQQVLLPKELDVNEVVRALEKMLRRVIREDIELSLSMTPGVAPVKVDRGQLEQVIVNLVVNARDAISDGGSIVVETEDRTVSEGFARARPGLAAGRYTVLTIRDSGEGMDPKTLSRVFEPFFTTKEIGRGTGLGLATAYGIVKQSHGFIEATSTLGVGSAFMVYLPALPGPLRAADERREAEEVRSGI